VTAEDQYGNTTPGYMGTVAFSSSDAGANLPANSGLTNGVGTFSVTLVTVGSSLLAGKQSVAANDTVNATIVGSTLVLVQPGPATHFSLSPSLATSDVSFLL